MVFVIKMKKGQFGIEFIYFVGIAMVILLIYLILTSTYLSGTLFRRDKIESKNLLEKIRNEINIAGRVENGYLREIVLPKKINNKDYSLTLKSREIYIRYPINSQDVYARLLSTDVSNQPILFFPGSSYYIIKNNNEVIITLKQ
jgi:hypothetical protein